MYQKRETVLTEKETDEIARLYVEAELANDRLVVRQRITAKGIALLLFLVGIIWLVFAWWIAVCSAVFVHVFLRELLSFYWRIEIHDGSGMRFSRTGAKWECEEKAALYQHLFNKMKESSPEIKDELLDRFAEEFPRDIDEIISSESVNNSGELYDCGLLYEASQDYKRASEKFLGAAELGHIEAQYKLAVYYFGGGRFVKVCPRQSFFWAQKAASQGHIEAQYLLGIFFNSGEGVDADVDESLKWMKLAYDGGHRQAGDFLRESGALE